MPDSAPPHRAAVFVRAQSQLFDFHLVYSLVTDEDDPSRADSDEQENPGPRRDSELGAAALIVAKGLIDPIDDWRYSGFARYDAVEWLAPGPRKGAFALGDRWNSVTLSGALPAIPCDFQIRCRGDRETLRHRRRAAEAGWGPDQLEHFEGWASIATPRWEGELSTAFPEVRELADAGATERANLYLDPERLNDRSLRERPALPFVVRFEPEVQLTLNPDAFEGLAVTLPPEQFLALQRLVEAGHSRVAWWRGGLLIAPGDFEVVIGGEQELDVATTDDNPSFQRKRFEYALGRLYREARLTWQPRLPPVEDWGRSAVHRALRDSLPELARWSLRERWSADRRRGVLASVRSLVLDCRLGLRMLERLELGDEERLRSKASELLAQGHDPTYKYWPLYELGTGKFDPLSFNRIDELVGHATSDALETLARRAEAVPGLWSPELARALLHGLLLAETGRYLDTQEVREKLYIGGISLRTPHDEFTKLTAITTLHSEVRKAKKRATWALFSTRLVDAALFSAFGTWIDGMRGLVIGFVLGWVVGGMRVDWARRQWGSSRAHQLQLTMQLTVSEAEQPTVSWWLVLRRMRDAALLGASWAPEAWRLATRAARRTPASRMEW